MEFGYVGVRYQEAPLTVREKVSFTDSKKIEVLQAMQRIGVEQCMVLSTCNRSEVFFFCFGEIEIESVVQCYENSFPAAEPGPYIQAKQGQEAFEYLFRIAAGLESLVLGEDQILGQVGEAIDFSRTMGYAGKELNKIVRDAVTSAKSLKTEYRISEKPLSVSYVGIQQLQRICPVKGARVLVIGSGKTASLALAHLWECEPERICVCSRSRSHAQSLKEKYPALEIRDFGERYELLGECSIVVSATSSPHLVVKKDKVLEVIQNRIVFLDLASPRDVDRELADVPGVEIIDLDTLQKICADNQAKREELAAKSSDRIGQSVQETLEWLRVSRMDDTIESLQKRCAQIVDDSYSYLERKIELEGREKRLVKKVLNASLQRLLKEPIQELKHLDTIEEQDAYKEMVEHLFQIER